MRKWIKKLTIGVLVVLGLLTISWVILQKTGKQRLDAELVEWRERGVEFQTSMPTFASADLGGTSEWVVMAELLDQLTGSVDKVLDDPGNASLEDLVSVVDSNPAVLRQVHEVVDSPRAPQSDFIYGSDQMQRLISDIETKRRLSRLLSAEAEVRAKQGDWVSAERAIMSSLSIADHAGEPDLLINLLLSAAKVPSVTYQIEDMFRSEGHPAELYDTLTAIDFKQRLATVMESEARYGMIIIETMKSPVWNHDWAYTLAVYRGVIESAQSDVTHLRDLSMPQDHPWWATIAAMVTETWPATFERLLQAQTRVDLAETAIILRQYKTKHGSYPATLNELVNLPTDPFTGGPFDYRREGEGFVLTSAGDNSGEPNDWHWDK